MSRPCRSPSARRAERPDATALRPGLPGHPAFDNGVRVALDRAGRVLGITGSPQPDLSVAPSPAKLSAARPCALQRSVGLTGPVRVCSGPSGARRTTDFAGGEQARLTLFGAAGGPRLAWRVDYEATTREHYDGIVDASTGRLLWRANRVKSDYSARSSTTTSARRRAGPRRASSRSPRPAGCPRRRPT